ncbi:peptidoglycan DD-metalloendopeptidase family protein [Arenimonas fontis]|uniref:Peptidoglycan DD-metalloendopeptidase family protein n=1 Tax=Arenimonas fontis TaxID=2608255 RepID=A0A5B2Z8K5_9GAMM|nr:peptidoglycan DD-metalloendopeptidase family protein [Arenimonas fontis]KAA2284227.1 peptidoglycan DD-metalloendopeptidase family protein [Arenimonas fontis]
MRQPARSPLSRWSHRHWLLAGLLVFLTALVATIVPGLAKATRKPPAQTGLATVELPLPAPAALPAPDARAAEEWLPVTVEAGQTLGGVFEELELPASLMYEALDVPGMREPLVRLRAGAVLEFQLGGKDGLRALRFERDEASRVELRRQEGRFVARVIERPLERRVMTASGEITSSLYAAGHRAGLGDAVIHQMANAFSYDIDFTQDLRVGDSFKVIYEEIWRDGERLRSGGVVAASFTNRGKEFTAVRWERNGKMEYFDLEGRPLKKSFMRMPIEFARISSRFNPRRKHPVLGTVRAHKGVDYAAATGTPIMAAGDGRVSFAGWQNGYGRTVIIDHGKGVTTLYAHMSRLGKHKVGQRVQQGSIIGYVGATGLASGPHLHYEFRVNGVHRDPLTVTMPKPDPLTGAELAAFRAATAPAVAQLKRVGGVQLASR